MDKVYQLHSVYLYYLSAPRLLLVVVRPTLEFTLYQGAYSVMCENRAHIVRNVHEQAMSVGSMYIPLIHCATPSYALGHLCLVSLLFMASLYNSTLSNSQNFIYL